MGYQSNCPSIPPGSNMLKHQLLPGHEHLQKILKNSISRLQHSYTGKRRSKIGRPTKKQRRDIEDFTGTDSDQTNSFLRSTDKSHILPFISS
jgi:hypothetical protein